MSTELIIAWISLAIALIGIGISVFAVLDSRKMVKKMLQLERKRVFTKIRNDMVWLFIDPTERSHTSEIAKGLEEFALLSMALDPKQTPDLTDSAVNNEALVFADKLVNAGFAVWKPGFSRSAVEKTLHDWQTSINQNRLDNILGKEQRKQSLF